MTNTSVFSLLLDCTVYQELKNTLMKLLNIILDRNITNMTQHEIITSITQYKITYKRSSSLNSTMTGIMQVNLFIVIKTLKVALLPHITYTQHHHEVFKVVQSATTAIHQLIDNVIKGGI